MDFVYDRTQADIDNRTAKGFLNAVDLNRVENNIDVISGKLALPFTKKIWARTGLPRVADFTRIRNGVNAIREGYGHYSDTPATPSQPLNTYQKWNDVERILHDVNEVYDRSMGALNYCGEVLAGEGIGTL
ncbi:MAG: hypothetical protein E7300_01040 [Lachnospiraceae bacterium]|nr:hypothetical protein [Lachnospiraceae bacterium]